MEGKTIRLLLFVLTFCLTGCDNPKVRISAMLGNAQAQYEMGHHYHFQKTLNKAFNWFLKAAEQGHAEAQCIVLT